MLFHFLTTSSGSEIGPILGWIELASIVVEVIAVLIIIISVIATTTNYIYSKFKPITEEERYNGFRIGLGRSLMLGLEVLIAADIIRTVALEATQESMIILGLLVVIRTFLSWSIVVEVEGRWPWQKEEK